jgi:cell division septum initiation protein DivIVA
MPFQAGATARRPPDRSADRGLQQLHWRIGVGVAAFGVVLLAVGFLVRANTFWSGLLVQVGSTLLLALPLVAVERLITSRIDDVQDQLETLRQETSDIANEYEDLRERLPPGPERTERMGAEYDRAQSRARRSTRSPGAVAALFQTGEEGDRMAALGYMAGDHGLIDAECVASAIRQTRSGYEQWKGLILTENAWAALTPAQLAPIMDAVEIELSDPNGKIHEANHRVEKAQALLQRAGRR